MDVWNEKLEALLPLITEQLSQGLSVKFSPYGTSMLPMLRQGIDKVVLSPVPERLRKYDLPLYRRENGQFILHRVVQTGQTYTCIGDHQFIPEEGVTHQQLIALVTGFYRKDRYISCRNPLYRLYCSFWHLSRPLRLFCRRGMGWLRRHLTKT